MSNPPAPPVIPSNAPRIDGSPWLIPGAQVEGSVITDAAQPRA